MFLLFLYQFRRKKPKGKKEKIKKRQVANLVCLFIQRNHLKVPIKRIPDLDPDPILDLDMDPEIAEILIGSGTEDRFFFR